MTFDMVKFVLVGAVLVMTTTDAFASRRNHVHGKHDLEASELIEANEAIHAGRVSVVKEVVDEEGDPRSRRSRRRRVTRLKVEVEATLKGKARRSLEASGCDYRLTEGDDTRDTLSTAGLKRGDHVVVFFMPGGGCSLAKSGPPGVTTLEEFRWSWNRERGHFDEVMELLEGRYCGDAPGDPGAQPGREPELLGYGMLTRLGEGGPRYGMDVIKAPAHARSSGVRFTSHPSELTVEFDRDYGLGEHAGGRITGTARGDGTYLVSLCRGSSLMSLSEVLREDSGEREARDDVHGRDAIRFECREPQSALSLYGEADVVALVKSSVVEWEPRARGPRAGFAQVRYGMDVLRLFKGSGAEVQREGIPVEMTLRGQTPAQSEWTSSDFDVSYMNTLAGTALVYLKRLGDGYQVEYCGASRRLTGDEAGALGGGGVPRSLVLHCDERNGPVSGQVDLLAAGQMKSLRRDGEAWLVRVGLSTVYAGDGFDASGDVVIEVDERELSFLPGVDVLWSLVDSGDGRFRLSSCEEQHLASGSSARLGGRQGTAIEELLAKRADDTRPRPASCSVGRRGAPVPVPVLGWVIVGWAARRKRSAACHSNPSR